MTNPIIPLALFLGFSVALPAQEVLYDITGTFDADTPTTAFTAPGHTFDLSFTVPSTFQAGSWGNMPFNGGVAVDEGSYSMDGLTLAVATNGSYGISSSGGNFSFMSLNTPQGGFGFSTRNVAGGYFPPLNLVSDATGLTTFATGDFGNVLMEDLYLSGTDLKLATIHGIGVALDPVPEPSSLALILVGTLSCGAFAFLFRKRIA